jgi:hypothetical protein
MHVFDPNSKSSDILSDGPVKDVFTMAWGSEIHIAKIQMTFPNCTDIYCVCIHTYFQAKLNSKSSDITIHMSDPNSKSSDILSGGEAVSVYTIVAHNFQID